jgi:hypothetical protein
MMPTVRGCTLPERNLHKLAGTRMRTNKVYFWLVCGLCIVYVVSVTLLPFTHGFTMRRTVAYSYATSKVTVFLVLYLWLILDDDKSLPWRNHPVVRHGTAAMILWLAFYYLRSVRSIDPHWAELAFWGAFLSAILAPTYALTRRAR